MGRRPVIPSERRLRRLTKSLAAVAGPVTLVCSISRRDSRGIEIWTAAVEINGHRIARIGLTPTNAVDTLHSHVAAMLAAERNAVIIASQTPITAINPNTKKGS